MTKKLNCTANNFQCGGRCLPKTNSCRIDAAERTAANLTKFSNLLQKPKTKNLQPRLPLQLISSPEALKKKFGEDLFLSTKNKGGFNAKLLQKVVDSGFDSGLLLSEVTSEIQETIKTTTASSRSQSSKLLEDTQKQLEKLVDLDVPVNGKIIGKGEYGKAYLVPVNGTNYILKEGKIGDEEIEVLNLLKEKGVDNVVKAIAAGEERGKGIGAKRRLVMDRAKGKPVSDLEPDEKLKVRESSKIFEVVKKVHEAGVAHGDLHGGNIFVEEDGNINLIDFGEAKKEATNADKYGDMAKLVNQKFKNKNEKELLDFMKAELELTGDPADLEGAMFGFIFGGANFNRSKLFENPELFKKFQAIYFNGY